MGIYTLVFFPRGLYVVRKNFYRGSNFTKIQDFYNNNARKSAKVKVRFKQAYRPLPIDSTNSLMVYTTDFFTNPAYFNLLNFNYYNNDFLVESLEDSYENIKNFKHIYYNSRQHLVSKALNFLSPVSYSSVLDSFRADFNEND
jgi:hypothetical protein